ncbi:MFS transporter [Streptomyces sp. SKN60]|uniref:MFS transporter n=1 Tax=Streptomyces sp. SKN60 TaxID=2855506 RepID=UPI002246A4A9|nr:MFS transporter [Streptomyces sp. SKN60]MCX2185020.1 MFS transporter [Streptomyces sp. SKN60]
MTDDSTAAPTRIDRLAVVVLYGAIVFEGMSLSGIGVQLSPVQRDLGLRADQLQWFATAFLVMYGGFLLPGGVAATAWGGRRVFRCGLLLFALGSAVVAVADGPWLVILGRGVQGAGAAFSVPAALALLMMTFPEGSARDRAIGAFGAMGAVGFCLGLVAQGGLTEAFGWRSPFAISSLLALALVTGSASIPPVARTSGRARTPWVSAVLIICCLLALIYAASGSAASAWAKLAGLATGMGLAVLFVTLQLRGRNPLIPRRILLDRRALSANGALGAVFAAVMANTVVVATALQDRNGYSPMDAGAVFLSQGLAVGAASPVASRLVSRWSVSVLMLIGAGLVLLGQVLCLLALDSNDVPLLLTAGLLAGTGIAGVYTAATVEVIGAVCERDHAVASGTLASCQQVGGAFGIAVVASLQGAPDHGGTSAALAACVLLAGCGLASAAVGSWTRH